MKSNDVACMHTYRYISAISLEALPTHICIRFSSSFVPLIERKTVGEENEGENAHFSPLQASSFMNNSVAGRALCTACIALFYMSRAILGLAS